ncbi:energy transducer TonB [Pseudomonas sp. R5(2019)]|uniref:energy transducer TonB n=1 Tax=Pseudomonas sp. R5(2019) TaxID=2697566 RepID=UPI0014129C75|nr:energy transducer TonB [Pseudomonas sp. R5(2019)]NBA94430.1 TonB family protein [Pseudomonas sp. R5(2019)]
MITTRQKLTRYSGSLAIVLGVHAVAILLALNWSAPQAIELPPAAMMVEMAPMPEPAPPPPPKVVTPPQPPAPVEEPPLPKLVEAPKPKIAIAKPVKPKAQPQPPKPEKKPEPPQEKPPAEETVDTPPSTAPAQKSTAQAPSIASNSNALPTWQSDLLRHLSKYKKYPEDARRRGMEGVNRLRFVVDGEGKVLSYSLANGSGSASLDRATMEMIRKAQPLPPPPKELLNNGSLEVVAPFVYSLDKR